MAVNLKKFTVNSERLSGEKEKIEKYEWIKASYVPISFDLIRSIQYIVYVKFFMVSY